MKAREGGFIVDMRRVEQCERYISFNSFEDYHGKVENIKCTLTTSHTASASLYNG